MSNDFYTLKVNGENHQVLDAWTGESLLWVLRERLGFPGAKIRAKKANAVPVQFE